MLHSPGENFAAYTLQTGTLQTRRTPPDTAARGGRRRASLGPLLVIGAWLGLGCTGDTDDPPAQAAQCLEGLALDCTPAYVPTYDAIFDDVLERSCGSAGTGGTCHYGPTAETAQGGLVLSDRDLAYDQLLGRGGASARVLPGDPQCSPLVARLESDDPGFRMPVGGSPLPEAARCAVRQWIANGAMR
jgi:hypothetical protein